jgi:hypothetical protein
VFVFQTSKSLAQSLDNIHVIPEVSIGYVFGVNFTWGIDMNITSFDVDIPNQNPASFGLGVSYNRLVHKRQTLGNWGFNVVGFSDHAFLKVGAAWMMTKWGENRINKTTSNGLGFNIELGGMISNKLPYLSIRMFDPINPCLWLPLRKQYQINLKYMYPVTIPMR